MIDNQNEIYSVKIRAGSRTYFLNVKEDKNGELYLVIKESKQSQDGNDVHRVMVFEEDFSKFISGMKETLEFIKKNQANRKIMDQNDDFDQDNIVMNIDNNSDIEQVKVVANPDISSDISEIIA
jgi:hypothetical protein